MQTDFAIELGCDDETLEFPWATPGGGPRYCDVKRQPELLLQIEEAVRFAELENFLALVNSAASILESAKCDAWSTTEIHPEEEIFGGACKFGSYVDLVFNQSDARYSFPTHEDFLKQITALLKRAPEIPASADFLLRRCLYHENAGIREGYYVTFYLFGYGRDEMTARLQWGIALKLAGHAIAQCSSRQM